jgi:hypothetical protein
MTPLQKCAKLRIDCRELKVRFKECQHALILCDYKVELARLFLEKCHYWNNSQLANRPKEEREPWALAEAKAVYRARLEERRKVLELTETDAEPTLLRLEVKGSAKL